MEAGRSRHNSTAQKNRMKIETSHKVKGSSGARDAERHRAKIDYVYSIAALAIRASLGTRILTPCFLSIT